MNKKNVTSDGESGLRENKYIELAHMVANHYKTVLVKSGANTDDRWVTLQRLSDSTYGEATGYGFDGSKIDWINIIGTFM